MGIDINLVKIVKCEIIKNLERSDVQHKSF